MHRTGFLVNGFKGATNQKFARCLLSKFAAPVICRATSVRCYTETSQTDSFMSASSSSYIEDMYNAWMADPSAVHAVSTNIIICKNNFDMR